MNFELRPWAARWSLLTIIALFALATYDIWTADEGLTSDLWLTWFVWGFCGSIILWILSWGRGE